MDIKDFQDRQAEFDARFWDHELGIPTRQHVGSHLDKLVGKLFGYIEVTQHGKTPDTEEIASEVIPDLLHHAARLANDLGVDLESSALQRHEQLTKKFTKD